MYKVQRKCVNRCLKPAVFSSCLLPLKYWRNVLIGRGTDSEEVIQTRLPKPVMRFEQSVLFDYVVVNDDLDRAEADLFHIIKAGRLKKSSQQGFISNLLEIRKKQRK